MNFRTEITPKTSSFTITHQTPIVGIGSCFAERIGTRLQASKFPVLVNPFGVIFNPLSLFEALRLTAEGKNLPENLYTKRDGAWFHYGVHSQFWANSQEELAYLLETQTNLAYNALKNAHYLFITLGTAWVYEKAGEAIPFTVANCHKQPAHFFEKRLLQVGEMVASFEAMQASLQALNPAIKIIFTVSPVRHLKDTLELNSVSKAVLRLAVHEMTQKFPHFYFPAYELLLDDLRDYRFYASDLLHPNEQGEQYIWEKFADTYFSTETKELVKKIQKITTGLAHKPLQGGVPYQKFLLTLQQQIETLPTYLDFEAEKQAIQQHL